MGLLIGLCWAAVPDEIIELQSKEHASTIPKYFPHGIKQDITGYNCPKVYLRFDTIVY